MDWWFVTLLKDHELVVHFALTFVVRLHPQRIEKEESEDTPSQHSSRCDSLLFYQCDGTRSISKEQAGLARGGYRVVLIFFCFCPLSSRLALHRITAPLVGRSGSTTRSIVQAFSGTGPSPVRGGSPEGGRPCTEKERPTGTKNIARHPRW